MAEGISKRVSRVLSGGMNRVMEAIESVAPEAVLEQTIREIETAGEEVRSEYGREVAGKHLAMRRLFDANKRHDELSEQLGLAVAEKRDDLAEVAIARQLDIEAQIPVIEQSIHDFSEREKQLEGFLKALLGRVREMREELTAYRAQKTAAESSAGSATPGGVHAGGEVTQRVRRAEEAFDRMLERLTGVSGSQQSTDMTSTAKLQELEQLSRSNRIKERLAATKANQVENL